MSWRSVSAFMAILWGMLTLFPLFLPSNWLNHWPLSQKELSLGLDLRGGVHLLMEVDESFLIEENSQFILNNLRKKFRQEKIPFKHLVYRPSEQQIQCLILSPDRKDEIDKFFQVEYGDMATLKQKTRFQDRQEMLVLSIHLRKKFLDQSIQRAIQKSIEIIRKRVDASGTKEPVIQSQGRQRILIQIPGAESTAAVKKLLGKTAKLSFHWVEEHPESTSRSSYRFLPQGHGPNLPVSKEILMTGEDILDARAETTPSYDTLSRGTPVSLKFSSRGSSIFSQLTQDENKGKRLAIVLDEKILSAPSIQSHIPNGHAQITGNANLSEASHLALMIRSGALPAPLKILEEKIVGPTLGQDSILRGTQATVLALCIVALWMLMIYGGFGIFAVIGLFFNVFFLISGLMSLGAVLTLPGLAGIAVTMGISLDANVLINERIKEELKTSQSLISCVKEGYKKAMSSIIDSNLTTFIGAALLYTVGSGPIRGFAITMALGILISLFTAVGLTRWLALFWIRTKKPKSLWI